jgi:hypothetical protein
MQPKLNCIRSNTDFQLTADLLQLEQIKEKLQERHNAATEYQ